MVERPIYPVCRVHFDELSDEIGVWQHAIGTKPNRTFGYCTDDVARALEVDLLHSGSLGWHAVEAGARRSLAFVSDAFNVRRGRFRNFRSAEGKWLEEVGSADCHARALAVLGFAMAGAPDAQFAGDAALLFDKALPATRALTDLRPMAAALLGCDAALRGGADGATSRAFRTLAVRLSDAFADLPSDWPWPEPVVTYENGLLSRALIAAGSRLDDETMLRTGCRALDWLAKAQTTDSGRLSLVGNRGWWRRGELPARFDQQPIEAASLLAAAEAALVATGEERYRQLAEMAYGWFLGDNDMSAPMAIPATGGCHDGLSPDGVNLNQGAESTLMWLTALEHLRRLRAASRPPESAIPGLASSVPQVTK